MYEGKLYSDRFYGEWSKYPEQSSVNHFCDLVLAYQVGLAGEPGKAQLPPGIPVLSDKEMHDRRDAGEGEIRRIWSPTLCYDVDAPPRWHVDRDVWPVSFAPLESIGTWVKSERGGPEYLDYDLRLVLAGIRKELEREPGVVGVTAPRLCFEPSGSPLCEVCVYVNVLVRPERESK